MIFNFFVSTVFVRVVVAGTEFSFPSLFAALQTRARVAVVNEISYAIANKLNRSRIYFIAIHVHFHMCCGCCCCCYCYRLKLLLNSLFLVFCISWQVVVNNWYKLMNVVYVSVGFLLVFACFTLKSQFISNQTRIAGGVLISDRPKATNNFVSFFGVRARVCVCVCVFGVSMSEYQLVEYACVWNCRLLWCWLIFRPHNKLSKSNHWIFLLHF